MFFFVHITNIMSPICWCNIIDILMANVSVYKWNKTSFSLHDYLPLTIFQKKCIISLIRNAIKRNWYFFNTLLSCEFFLFFVRYRIRSPEVNIQLLLLWFLLSPLNYIILKNQSYQRGSCDHSFYRSQWVEQKLKCNLCSKFHILATSVDEPIPA